METKQENYEENLKRTNITLEKIISIHEEELKVLKNINELQDKYISKDYLKIITENWRTLFLWNQKGKKNQAIDSSPQGYVI